MWEGVENESKRAAIAASATSPTDRAASWLDSVQAVLRIRDRAQAAGLSREALAELRGILETTLHPAAAAQAAVGLAEAGPNGAEALREVLGRADDDRRAVILEVLVRWDLATDGEVARALREPDPAWGCRIEALRSGRSDAAPDLQDDVWRLVLDSDAEMALVAAMSLADARRIDREALTQVDAEALRALHARRLLGTEDYRSALLLKAGRSGLGAETWCDLLSIGLSLRELEDVANGTGDRGTVEAAIEAVTARGGAEERGRLIRELLESDRAATREVTARLVVRTGDEAALRAVVESRASTEARLAALDRVGSASGSVEAGALADVLARSPATEDRMVAAAWTGRQPSAELLRRAVEFLNDGDWDVRWAAAESLAQNPAVGSEHVRELAGDEIDFVRLGAMVSAAPGGGVEAAVVERALRSPNALLSRAAADVLAKCTFEGRYELALSLMRSTDDTVRRAAMRVVAETAPGAWPPETALDERGVEEYTEEVAEWLIAGSHAHRPVADVVLRDGVRAERGETVVSSIHAALVCDMEIDVAVVAERVRKLHSGDLGGLLRRLARPGIELARASALVTQVCRDALRSGSSEVRGLASRVVVRWGLTPLLPDVADAARAGSTECGWALGEMGEPGVATLANQAAGWPPADRLAVLPAVVLGTQRGARADPGDERGATATGLRAIRVLSDGRIGPTASADLVSIARGATAFGALPYWRESASRVECETALALLATRGWVPRMGGWMEIEARLRSQRAGSAR